MSITILFNSNLVIRIFSNIFVVQGFLFKNAKDTSIMLYGTPASEATFYDCHWEVCIYISVERLTGHIKVLTL